jgi:dTDP-4-dehydrorhamnose 3,5-epimerase
MQRLNTKLDGVTLIEPKVFEDDRGWFMEAFNEAAFRNLGLPSHFIQDNQSHSRRNVLRGLHYQVERPQGKLVRVLAGRIFDVVVDLRPLSSTRGSWAGFELSGENRHSLWIPENFAHGFVVLSETADVLYKVTSPYDPKTERTLRWDDPEVGIHWQLTGRPILSPKDEAGQFWGEADLPVVQESI